MEIIKKEQSVDDKLPRRPRCRLCALLLAAAVVVDVFFSVEVVRSNPEGAVYRKEAALEMRCGEAAERVQMGEHKKLKSL